MGIQLDWQIDDIDGQEAVEEDPQIIADRQRRKQRSRRLLIFLLCFLISGGVAAGLRLRQSNLARRAALQAIVTAETLALRIGDRDAFLDAQDPSAEWRQTQSRAFSRYQALAPRVQLTDEILDITFHPQESEVRVRITVDDQPSELRWIYTYRNGWQHTASLDDPWEILSHRVDHLAFSYYAVDQAVVDSLERDLTGWLDEVCYDHICDHLSRISIRPRLSDEIEPQWRDEDQDTLFVPLPRPAAGDPAPELYTETTEQLYVMLAERWARDMLSDARANREKWMLEETTTWLLRSIDGIVEPTLVLDPLYAAFGPDMIADSFDAMHEGFPARTAFRMAARGQTRANLTDEELARHLTLLLQVEAVLPSDFPIAWTDILFLDQDDVRDSSTTVDDFLDRYNINQVNPHTLHVLDVHRHGRIVWAEMVYSLHPDTDLLEPLPVTYQPFTYDEGGWVHLTRLRREERLLLRGDTITLLYGETDVDDVDDLLPYAEAVYEQVSADLALEDRPPISMEITPYIPYAQSASYAVIYPRIASVYVNCCKPGVDPLTHLQQETAYAIVREVLAYQLGDRTTSTALGHAMLFAEWERLGLDVELPPSVNSPGAFPLSDVFDPETMLERREGGFVQSSPTYTTDRARLISAIILLEVLHERYGDDMLSALASNYNEALSLDDLLERAFSISLDDIRDDWWLSLWNYVT